jgi:hypothetical protein
MRAEHVDTLAEHVAMPAGHAVEHRQPVADLAAAHAADSAAAMQVAADTAAADTGKTLRY